VSRAAAIVGIALVAIYTALISGADGITKLIAGGYAAPQLYALSGALVVGFCIATARLAGQASPLRTGRPRAMALRSAATVVASLAFFEAFRALPLAEVFLFIALMPILAGLMSGPILGEHVRPVAWIALGAGAVGVTCLFPAGLQSVGAGHLWALLAAVAGTFSMVLARFIGRSERNALAQVLYPNLAILAAMGVALPFVWQPMPLADLGWVAAYALLLFGARWVLVVALRLLAAYVATPLMNLQFIWMAVIGAAFFGEYPTSATYLGAAIVIGSGLVLIWDQLAPIRLLMPIIGGAPRTDP
jgi:drug/metabolite transporter (DMT)-like permease